MPDKVTKKDLISNFRKLSIDNLINLAVLTDYCISRTEKESYYRSVMFDDESEYHELCKFNAYIKLYLFDNNSFPNLAHFLGVADD